MNNPIQDRSLLPARTEGPLHSRPRQLRSFLLGVYSMQEEWRAVVGYEGSYEVSNTGRVRSVNRIRKNQHGPIVLKGRLLKPTLRSDRYLAVRLYKNSKAQALAMHSLVLNAFVGPRPTPKSDAMHLDNNRSNNHLPNLRWGSRSCNMAFMIDDGTVQRGSKNYWSKLTETDVLEIKRLISLGTHTTIGLSAMYNMNQSTISRIKNGQKWGWLQ